MARSVCLALFGVAAWLVVSACAQQEITGLATEGGLDQCSVILGSVAAGDGTFDKDSDFSASISDGAWSVPLSGILNNTGDVLYVVPAARSANYNPLTLADRQSAGYCYDTFTLLPQYNPLAVMIPYEDNVTEVVVNPVTTLLAFGWAYGLREDSLRTALGFWNISTYQSSSYNALEEFQNDPYGAGAFAYKQGVKLENLITLGATLLANGTDSYAAFAVLMEQSLGRTALNASNFHWNMHSSSTDAALNLNDPHTLEYAFWNAGQYVHASRDWLLPNQLNELPQAAYIAMGVAAANLNEATDDATTEADIAKTQYYAQNTLGPQVEELTTGSLSLEDFETATSPSSLSTGLAAVVLPSAQSPSPTGSPYLASSTTQAAAESSREAGSGSDSGLSGGAIAGIVIACVVGVALLALAAVLLVRRSSTGTPKLWGRRNHDEISSSTV